MEFGLDQRNALITGGSRGIGFAAAYALGKEGCRVMICSRNPDGVEAAVAELRSQHIDAHGTTADLASVDGPAQAVRAAQEAMGSVDILVANAGGPAAGAFETLTEDDWTAAIDVSLRSVVRLVREVVPGMRASGWGRIVTVTSRSAREAVDNLVLSNSLRSGVAGLVRSLARELGPAGIRVNNVMPGIVLTDRLRSLVGDDDDKLRALAKELPLRRLGRPDELGAAIAFLASEPASYISGASLLVDGAESRVIA